MNRVKTGIDVFKIVQVVRQAGAAVTQAGGGAALHYNKEDLLNPWFVAARGKTGDLK